MYGYLIGDVFMEAPNRINVKGTTIFNPKEEHYLKAGFLPLIQLTENDHAPDDGKFYSVGYEQRDDGIYEIWVESSPPVEITKPEASIDSRVTKLETKLGIILNKTHESEEKTLEERISALEEELSKLGGNI